MVKWKRRGSLYRGPRPLRSSNRAVLRAERGPARCSVQSVSETAACRHDSAGSLNPPIQRSSNSSTAAVQMRDESTTAHALKPRARVSERQRFLFELYTVIFIQIKYILFILHSIIINHYIKNIVYNINIKQNKKCINTAKNTIQRKVASSLAYLYAVLVILFVCNCTINLYSIFNAVQF